MANSLKNESWTKHVIAYRYLALDEINSILIHHIISLKCTKSINFDACSDEVVLIFCWYWKDSRVVEQNNFVNMQYINYGGECVYSVRVNSQQLLRLQIADHESLNDIVDYVEDLLQQGKRGIIEMITNKFYLNK